MSLLPHRGKTGKVGRCTLADVARTHAAAIVQEAVEKANQTYPAGEAYRHGAQEERDRCLRICRQYPDNLMARELAKQIKSGFSPIAQ